jgi:ATP-dependent DNA helicase RecG
MAITIKQLEVWMKATEDEHLEFKEAKKRFATEELAKYCCALANEGGGHLVLGVTNKRPRTVVGSAACPDLGRAKGDIYRDLGIRVDAWEVDHPAGRVVVFQVPGYIVGAPIHYKGSYLMRAGEDVVPMGPDRLRSMLMPSQVVDFSAEFCPGAAMTDLNPDAIEQFRKLWQKKSGLVTLEQLDHERLLIDAELISEGRVTYAALLLFGTRAALGRHLA